VGSPARHRLDRNQTHDRMTVAGQDDLVTAHQFGQLSFGVGNVLEPRSWEVL
jgi:hypothetical protein